MIAHHGPGVDRQRALVAGQLRRERVEREREPFRHSLIFMLVKFSVTDMPRSFSE